MKRPIIAGNWKMNLPWPEAQEIVFNLTQKLSEPINAEIIIFPAFTVLKAVHSLLDETEIKIGGQNMCSQVKGAYTGEVSADMLLDSGCSHVLLGHSERRTLFGETDSQINEKLHLALDKNLLPILCVGETLDQRETNKTEETLKTQISICFQDIKSDMLNHIIIAYEPVWAIGTGKNATPEQACETHGFIRSTLKELYGFEASDKMSIIYGGSVNPHNSSQILDKEGVDGVLVGTSSLIAESFYAIISSIN
jgi:triosephosphate isomerase (TIM)